MNDQTTRPISSLTTRLSRPASNLESFVWCYGQNSGVVHGSRINLPLPARPKNVLTFFFASGPAPSLVHGPQSHQQVEISMFGRIDNFTIHFQPSGFHRLFGVPMQELANAAHSAESVLGQIATDLRNRLSEAPTFAERVHITDHLLSQLAESASPRDAVGAAANQVFASHGQVRVDAMASACDISVRQFERRFRIATGLSPKLYASIARFNAAVFRKLCRPDASWAEIAADCGYSDQMHLVRGFRAFAGDTPTRFDARLRLAPELRSMFATEDLASRLKPAAEMSPSFYQLSAARLTSVEQYRLGSRS